MLVPFQSMIDEALALQPAEYWAKDGVSPSKAGAAPPQSRVLSFDPRALITATLGAALFLLALRYRTLPG